jgi:hypothetical protein
MKMVSHSADLPLTPNRKLSATLKEQSSPAHW